MVEASARSSDGAGDDRTRSLKRDLNERIV
jgi:hypothetical protein